jgi:hypothetical protein
MNGIISTFLIALMISSCSGEQKMANITTPISEKEIPALITQRQDDPIKDKGSFCRDEKEAMRQGLATAYRLYQIGKSPKSIKLLVEIDGKIRSLITTRPEYRPCKDDTDIYDPKWKEIDVHLGYWGDFVYTGNLLYRAHQRAPNSSFRQYTLFSLVMGITESHQLGLMPNIKAAFQYEKEFPQGPFIEETHWIIAGFYKDLFMVLRDDLRDYKYDCFKPYIDKTPIQAQMQRTKANAITSYQMILKLHPANIRAAELLNEVQRGTVKAWSFCAD